MIQVCSRCGTRWNVRDRQRVWCPRCNGTLLAPSAATATVGVERTSDRARRAPERSPRQAGRRGCRGIPLDRGSARCRTAFPPQATEPGPHSALCGDSPLGSGRAVRHRRVRAAGRAASRAVARRAARHAGRDDRGARPRRARAHGAIRAADHQPQRAVEPGGGVVGDLARRSGQRGRPLPGVRKHRCC